MRSTTDPISETVTRRHALGLLAGATATLSGCGLLGGSPPDVAVFNRRDSTVEATLTVTSDGESLAETTQSLDPDQGFKREDVFPSSGSATVAVAVTDGPSKESDVDLSETDAVQAQVQSDGIQFERP